MVQQPVTFLRLIQRTVFRHPEGVEGMAEELGKATSTLYSELNPDSETTHKLGVMDWVKILRKTNDLTSLEKLNSEFNLIPIQVPQIPVLNQDPAAIVAKLATAVAESSEAVAKTATALADGTLTARERRECKEEFWQAICALAELWKAME